MDLVILNHGQVTRTTPELPSPSPNFHSTPMGECLSLSEFKVHWHPLHGLSSAVLGAFLVHPFPTRNLRMNVDPFPRKTKWIP
ncbi:hypothetical protein TNCV_4714221 [Trichonephila clavipes]|nr:hypothetical protein TNCV_4714221 [Trichonephila clavipes]